LPGQEEPEARLYEITAGGEQIKAIGDFEITYVGGSDRPQDLEEKTYANFLNGAVGNISENALRNRSGASRKDGIFTAGARSTTAY
jgi:hypothetical protein